MKTPKISAKIGVLPNETRTNLDTIIKRMKAGREWSCNDSRFSDSRIVRCELVDQDAKLINNEFISNDKTDIIIKNREYSIDNKSGEVTLNINPLKYIFISCKKALNKVGSLIEIIKDNFDNPEKVQPVRLEILGFSREKIEQLRDKIEKYQKESLNQCE